jgi:TolB-like protein
MPLPARLKNSRIVQAVGVYAATAWIVLEVVGLLRENLALPRSVFVTALVLLAIGLLVVVATAWVQSRPGLAERAEAEEVPEAWELDAGDFVRSLSEGRLPHLTWARALVGGAASFLLLFGLAGLYVVIQDRGESFFVTEAEAAVAPGIAVMPFTVRGPDAEVWREGMMDLLSTNLDGVGGLRAIHARTVLARWRERGLGDAADLDQVLDAARATGARLAIVGSAVGAGSSVRLTAELYDLDDGGSVDEATIEGAQDDILALVDQLSVDLVRRVLEQEGAEQTGLRSLANLTTSSLPALRAYLEGESLYRRADFEGANSAFRRAIAADSLFAMAYHRLTATLGWTYGTGDERDEVGRRARQLADRLPPRDSVLVATSDRALRQGDARAIDDLEALAARYPDDPEVLYWLGEAYNHVGAIALIPVEEMGGAFEGAISLDSAFVPAYIHAIEAALSFHEMEKARVLLAQFERYGQGVDDLDRMRFMVRFTLNEDGLVGALAETPDGDLYELVINMDDAATGTDPLLDRLTAEALIRRQMGGATDFGPATAAIARVHVLLSRGRFRELRRVLPLIPQPERALVATRAWLDGAVELDPSIIPDGGGLHALQFGAVAAAATGQWQDFDSRLESLRAFPPPAGVTDEDLRQEIDPIVAGLEAWALWIRDGGEAAIPALEAAHRFARQSGEAGVHLSEFLALALERAHTAAGRHADALPYARSHRSDGFATWRTVQLYEALGRGDEAARLLPLVALTWDQADEGIPEVEEFRARR